MRCVQRAVHIGRAVRGNLGDDMTQPHVPPNAEHDHTPEEERQIREAALDETIASTFPASDPPSTIPNPDEHDALIEGQG